MQAFWCYYFGDSWHATYSWYHRIPGILWLYVFIYWCDWIFFIANGEIFCVLYQSAWDGESNGTKVISLSVVFIFCLVLFCCFYCSKHSSFFVNCYFSWLMKFLLFLLKKKGEILLMYNNLMDKCLPGSSIIFFECKLNSRIGQWWNLRTWVILLNCRLEND